MNVINEVGFVSNAWRKLKEIFVSGVTTLIVEVDGEGRVKNACENSGRIIMNEDWCIPVENMRYDGLSLVVVDKNSLQAGFKVEQIEEWSLSNQDRVIIGPFKRETCDTSYLNVGKISDLLSEICSCGVYEMKVLTKSGEFDVEIKVVDYVRNRC